MSTDNEEKPTFTQDDLSHLKSDDGAGGDDTSGDKGTTDQGDKGAGDQADKGVGDKGQDDKGAGDDKGGKKTIAGGGDAEADDKAKADAEAKGKPYWPDDWREKLAQHYAAGDQKIYKKELARLQRITDPAGVYGMARELEGKFTSGGLIKVPGKDAKPEDVAAFHKALGVPEEAKDYLKDLKLENGAVIGEADKPIVEGFTQALHKAGAPPATVAAALNWYYARQEAVAAELDDADDSFRRESEKALKEELGPAFKRQTNAIATLFVTAPGGADAKNPGSLMSRILGGRTADGKIIGNDPDISRWLIGMVGEINPAATVAEDGNQSGKSIDDELKAIDKVRREDRQAYNKDYPMQARERELLEAQAKLQTRG